MMRRLVLLVPLVVGAAVVLGGGMGCSPFTGPEADRAVEHAVAEVDSLDVPDRISVSDTLAVRLIGTVGPNDCYSFDRFETRQLSAKRPANRLTVVPVVEHQTGDDGACTGEAVPLDETYVAASPHRRGELTVVVPRPARSDLTATVSIQ